jgi:ubiquinone/menaquinone biosynthesis C-methylase UbiE
MQHDQVEQLFAGLIGEHYELLKTICPAAPEMSRRVGAKVAQWPGGGEPLQVVELGCGTGITSIALLSGRAMRLLAVDSEPTMLNQARQHLAQWQEQGVLQLVEQDALSALRALPDGGCDVVASAYTLHNFFDGYRREVLAEALRVLKPGGWFVNGDRYALDDVREHCRLTQEEMRGYFREFSRIQRYDLLEQWIVHLYHDESPDHIMRLAPNLAAMAELGYQDLAVEYRNGVNALVCAAKPA